MGCMQNRIGECGTVRHWRLSELTFTPLLLSSVISHLVRIAGIRNSGKGVGPCQAFSICIKAWDACQAPSICVKARDACHTVKNGVLRYTFAMVFWDTFIYVGVS